MTWDPIWERVFANQEWGRYPAEDLIRFVARNLYDVPNRATTRVLEVGPGPGANLWFLAREGFAAYGIEGSPSAAARARQRLDAECPGWNARAGGGEVVTGDMVRLPWVEAYFDAAIDSEAVYCNDFEESCRIYREMHRVTRPGGRLFVRTFASGTWGEATGVSMGNRRYIADRGPLAGKGPSRFTALHEIPVLLAPWQIGEINLITRTVHSQSQSVHEWIIEASKA